MKIDWSCREWHLFLYEEKLARFKLRIDEKSDRPSDALVFRVLEKCKLCLSKKFNIISNSWHEYNQIVLSQKCDLVKIMLSYYDHMMGFK